MQTCKALFGREYGKKTEEYVFAKSFTFRWFYTHPDKTDTEPGQLRTYKVNISPAVLAIAPARMNAAHPAIVMWKREQIRRLHATKRVSNPFGRYRNLGWALRGRNPKLVAHAENVCLNFPIQTTIGEIMNRAFIRAWDALERHDVTKESRLIIQCHDELVALCPDDEVEPTKRILKWAIEQPTPELDGLVIPAEFKIGETWGEAA